MTVNDVDTTITQDMIDNGFITSLDVPDSGTLFVRATVEYADGSISGTGKDFARVGIIARDDADELELGDLQIAQIPVYTNETYDLLNLAEATDGSEGTLPFTVSESSNGTVDIEVSQTALVTVADAINIEIYDSNGDRVYVGTNNGDTPLVGNAVGLEFLGLTGNDTLTATVSGLEPGEYRIVVRNDESALEDLVNELTLADLGEAGVVLGPDNQDAVLDAVESALNGSILGPLGSVLGTTVRGVLEGVLDLTTDIGVGELVNIITGNAVINGLLGGAVDPLLDAIADALLSNTLTLLETTNITATLTEFDYADDTAITGNVIDPDGGIEGEDGEDTVTSTTTLTAITSNNVSESVPTSTEVGGVEVFTIVGQYGVLVIDETGEYTYTANGDYASAGQTETFTYTVANGIGSDMAELVIELAVDTTPPDAPTVNTPIADDDVVNGMEAEDGFAITGTGDFGDDVTLTNETGDVIGTAIVDISGNWSVLVDQADVDAMGEDSETITVIATDPFGNVSAPAAVVFDIDTVAPAAPTLNVNEAGTEITGASEADAFVEIDADGDGTVDYNTTADGHGNYVIDSSAAPLINGETVTATATDAAGNKSDPSSVEVPVKLVANDDPAVAGLDVTPTSSTTTSNDDSNLKDTETSALNLLGIGSFEVSVDFTVAANNIGSAEVNFSSTGIANVLDNGSLVLQKKDEDDNYVNVDSAASATGLLNVLDLLGDGVPDGYTLSGLTAGDYRLVGSVNPAVGLLTTGTLEVVTLTETSITEIDAIQAVNATGNVIDENDVSTDDTVVTTVTFDGNDTPIIASGDTSITGTYGTLLINADGDYTYTPTENASGIGKEDVFSYTIIDTETGSTDSATLTVSIESDYPAVDFPIDAVDDFATAELVVHPETTIHTVDEAASAGTLSDGVSEVEDTFTISNGSEGSAVFSVDSSGAAALTGGMHFTLEKQTGTGWIEIADEDDGNPPPLGGFLGGRFVIEVGDLEPGSYRVRAEIDAVGASSIELDGNVTIVTPNEPGVYDSIVASGNVISENDDVTLSTVVTAVDGAAVSTDIAGSYGTLTMNADGSYFYTPNPNVNVINQVESFEYTILDDYGNTDTATLTINITSDWASPAAEPTMDIIAVDDVVDAQEADDGFDVTGTGEDGASITLTDETGYVIGTATVAGGVWSIPVDQADVDAIGQGNVTITATATDTSNNVSDPVSRDILIDTQAVIEVTINDLTDDDIIDAADSDLITISGTVTGEFQAGDEVILDGLDGLDGTEVKGIVDAAGDWSISGVSKDHFMQDSDASFGVSISIDDDLGNTGTAQATKSYTVGPIAIDDVATAEIVVDGSEVTGVSATGNVITGLYSDYVTSGTVVSLVGSTAIDAATLIEGDYGNLIIGADGAYTYMPTTDIAGIDQIDSFEYTIEDASNGRTDTATLEVTIESDYTLPAAGARMMLGSDFTVADDEESIELPDTSMTSSKGLDTLSFEGADQNISLADIMEPEVIDIIDISGTGANTLNVAAEDIESDIYVQGDADDTVNLEGDNWSETGESTIKGGEVFNTWQSTDDSLAQIHIDTNVNII